MNHRFTKFVATVASAAALALAALGSAGVASAISADDAYLNDLSSAGVDVKSPRAAIALGHTICSQLDSGRNPVAILSDIAKAGELSDYQAGAIVAAAAGVYCPKYAG
jgi:predicted Zn-dependent protease